MISQKKLLLAVLTIIVAVSLAGWIVLLRGFKIEPDSNTNAANTNISDINTAPNDNINGQQLNVNNQPIDTSDWQTYRNEELGFEVKIPNGWFVDEDIITSYDRTTITDDKLEAFKARRVKFELNSGPLCASALVSDCFSVIDDYIKKDDGLTKRLSVVYITQNGLNGALIESEIPGVAATVSQITTAYFIDKSGGHSITYYGDHSDQYRDIFRTFLTQVNFLP